MIPSYPQAERGDGEEVAGRFRLGDVEEQQNLTWLSQLQYQAGVVSRQQALDAGFTGEGDRVAACAPARGSACIAGSTRLSPGTCRGKRDYGLRRFGRGRERCSAMRPPPRSSISPTNRATRIHISVPARAASRAAHEDPGRGYPQVAGAGCGMAAAVASAADHGGGHRARPDCRGADLQRRLWLGLGRRRPSPHHARTARQGARRRARGCAGAAGSPPPCRTPPTACIPRWSGSMCTASSAPTGCRRPAAGQAQARQR